MFQVIVAWDCIGYRGKMGGWGGGGLGEEYIFQEF